MVGWHVGYGMGQPLKHGPHTHRMSPRRTDCPKASLRRFSSCCCRRRCSSWSAPSLMSRPSSSMRTLAWWDVGRDGRWTIDDRSSHRIALHALTHAQGRTDVPRTCRARPPTRTSARPRHRPPLRRRLPRRAAAAGSWPTGTPTTPLLVLHALLGVFESRNKIDSEERRGA